MRNHITPMALAITLLALPAHAAETQQGEEGYIMDEITVTATKREQRVKDYDDNHLPWSSARAYNLGGWGTLMSLVFFAQADFLGSGKQCFDAENSLSDSGYKTINVPLGYRGENREVSVWGKNIFDDRSATKRLIANGQTIVEDSAPMTVGTSVMWRF